MKTELKMMDCRVEGGPPALERTISVNSNRFWQSASHVLQILSQFPEKAVQAKILLEQVRLFSKAKFLICHAGTKTPYWLLAAAAMR